MSQYSGSDVAVNYGLSMKRPIISMGSLVADDHTPKRKLRLTVMLTIINIVTMNIINLRKEYFYVYVGKDTCDVDVM